MSWGEKIASTDDTCPIYMHRSPHDQALGKKEVQVTALIVSQACIPSPNYCTALGQLLAIPLALPRHVSAIRGRQKTPPPLHSLLAAISRDILLRGTCIARRLSWTPRKSQRIGGGRVYRWR